MFHKIYEFMYLFSKLSTIYMQSSRYRVIIMCKIRSHMLQKTLVKVIPRYSVYNFWKHVYIRVLWVWKICSFAQLTGERDEIPDSVEAKRIFGSFVGSYKKQCNIYAKISPSKKLLLKRFFFSFMPYYSPSRSMNHLFFLQNKPMTIWFE